MVFRFVQKFFLRTTQELEYLLIFSCKARIYFPEFNIRLYDKHSESDILYFFSSIKIKIFFSATLGIRIIFFLKAITPFKLNGRSLMDFWSPITRICSFILKRGLIQKFHIFKSYIEFCYFSSNFGFLLLTGLYWELLEVCRWISSILYCFLNKFAR